MDKKWKDCSKERLSQDSYAANIKTKEILAIKVTNEKVHNGRRMLKELVNHVLDKHATKIESVLAYGSHYTNRNFRYLEENEITPGIKVRKNSILYIRNNRLRNMEVIRLQTKEGLLKWKMKRKYGNRWWIA